MLCRKSHLSLGYLSLCTKVEDGTRVWILTDRRGPIHSGENFDKAIAAGLVDPKVIAAGTMMKRMGRVEECAKVLAFLMSDDASYITGGYMPVPALLERKELC